MGASQIRFTESGWELPWHYCSTYFIKTQNSLMAKMVFKYLASCTCKKKKKVSTHIQAHKYLLAVDFLWSTLYPPLHTQFLPSPMPLCHNHDQVFYSLWVVMFISSLVSSYLFFSLLRTEEKPADTVRGPKNEAAEVRRPEAREPCSHCW